VVHGSPSQFSIAWGWRTRAADHFWLRKPKKRKEKMVGKMATNTAFSSTRVTGKHAASFFLSE